MAHQRRRAVDGQLERHLIRPARRQRAPAPSWSSPDAAIVSVSSATPAARTPSAVDVRLADEVLVVHVRRQLGDLVALHDRATARSRRRRCAGASSCARRAPWPVTLPATPLTPSARSCDRSRDAMFASTVPLPAVSTVPCASTFVPATCATRPFRSMVPFGPLPCPLASRRTSPCGAPGDGRAPDRCRARSPSPTSRSTGAVVASVASTTSRPAGGLATTDTRQLVGRPVGLDLDVPLAAQLHVGHELAQLGAVGVERQRHALGGDGAAVDGRAALARQRRAQRLRASATSSASSPASIFAVAADAWRAPRSVGVARAPC